MDFLKNKHDILTSLQTVKICLINCVVILCFSMQRRLTHLERVKTQIIFMFTSVEKINTF